MSQAPLPTPMQKNNAFEKTLEAPGPTIPTYRPSSQSSKRTYTMSALAPKYQEYLSMADDIHSTNKPKAQPSNENVTEIVRFLQTHSTTQGPSQSTGAKDMFKAGQRRLKLALRNKKGTESKTKGDDVSRQLAALQQQGSFPRSQYRRWGHKKSVASTASSSKSVSDLSYQSNSKRDVETIGRPWLENPIERRNAPGSKASSQVSSLDLRDLASFVEAHVNFSSFDDSNLAPYEDPSEQHAKTAATATSAGERLLQSFVPPEIVRASTPNSELGHKSSRELPVSLRINGPTQLQISSENQKLGRQSSRELQPNSASTATKPPSSSWSTSSKGSSAPTTPILKLFPDTMSPRMSSKKALRIPPSRSPTPNRSLSPVPDSQSTTSLASVVEMDRRDARNSSSSLPKIQEDIPETCTREQPTYAKHEQPSGVAAESLETEETQIRRLRHHSSLPPGAIDAFPIPAPARPLPIVPQPDSVESVGVRESLMIQQTASINSKRPQPERLVSVPPYINVSGPSSPENSMGSSRGRDSPFPRLMNGSVDPASIVPRPIQSRRGSLGKGTRSREDKVRSVIMRDLAASRHQKISSKDETETKSSEGKRANQLSLPNRGDSRLAQRQYQRKISPGPSSPPPMSPPPSNPPRHTLQGRRYCTSPASTMAATIENFENLSRPSSNRNHRVYPRDGVKAEVKPERESLEKDIDRPETPLPSSDDEGPVGDFYWNPPRKTQGRRRRGRPAPIVIDKPASDRGRSLKKHHATASREPPTPRIHKRHNLEKTSHSHLSPNDHQTYDSQGYREPEPKPNPSLEGRIEHLERQNKILQAALLAALDVGVKQDLSSLLGASAVSLSTNATPPLTGRSFSSTTNTSTSEASSVEKDRHTRNEEGRYHPDSWAGSPDSFRRGHYDSEGAETRELEEMIDEFDLDWLSDRSSVMD
ncbi:hypothetical protein BDV12DRAFT_58730 [Aspergillus spectabilis]